jgi:diguanylate cyclase (GGDEF)-like protein
VLLVGPEAAAAERLCRALLTLPEPEVGDLTPGRDPVRKSDSLLEAVLLSGEPVGTGGRNGLAAAGQRLILAGVSQELEHLEAAVRSLRRVNPAARILLLCEPADEVPCRKAIQWGADEYVLVPVDPAALQRAFAPRPPATRRPIDGVAADPSRSPVHSAAAAAGPCAADAGGAAGHLPGIPLIVQTDLLEDLLAGRADLADHLVQVLARHLPVREPLRFVSATLDASLVEGAIRRPVAQADQPPFGTLVLNAPEASPATAAVVAQAANWLAGMLGLSRRYEQLRSLAITDELSGAYNRRYFMKYMATVLERAKENRTRVTLLLFDIDDFKKYNDRFGHAAGDAIIRELIKVLRACTREYDLVARIGGDEFAVVYRDNEAPRQPNSEHPRDVLAATERFRDAIRGHQWPEICKIQGEVSISGGLASFPWDADTLETLMAKADEALLKAKAAGKNVIKMHAGEGANRPSGRPSP